MTEDTLYTGRCSHLAPARGADDQQPLALGRGLLEQHEQGLQGAQGEGKCTGEVRCDLQGQVGVSGPDGSVVEQPLDVVHHHARLVGPGQVGVDVRCNISAPHQSPVGVIKDLLDLETLGGLGEANLHTGCWYGLHDIS